MASILYVRATSSLSSEELRKRLLERKPHFLEIEGLLQKVYAQDPETGAVCGIYFFDSDASLAKFQQTDLAKSIPSAYEVTDIRIEKYNTLYALREGVGPI